MSTPMVFVACLGGEVFAVTATSVEPGPTKTTAVLDGNAVLSVGAATPWLFVSAEVYKKWEHASPDNMRSLFRDFFGPRR